MISGVDSAGDQFLADLSRVQASAERAQRQISSGLKVSEASDAPDQIGALLQLHANLGRNAQIQTNLARVKSEVDTAEQTVGQALQVADRAAVLASEGSSNTQTAANRSSIAKEVEGIQQDLVALTQANVDGRFIFSGDADQQASYQLDLTSPNGVQRLTTAAATRQIEDPAGGVFSVAKTAQDLFDHRNADDSLAPDNLFAAVNGLRVALENNDQAGITKAITTIRQASDYVNNQQSFYGGAQNRITAAVDLAGRNDVSLNAQLSASRDADLTAAAIDLTNANTQLTASLSARAKLPKTSLFDFLG